VNLARLAALPLTFLLSGGVLLTASPAFADPEETSTCAYRVKARTHVYAKPSAESRSYERFAKKGRTIGACEADEKWTRVLAPKRGKLGWARTARLKNLGPAKYLDL
jgi:hypothetical protein